MSGGVILVLALYFVPAINAGLRGHHNSGAIFALNLLLGWTALGWIIALVWSFTAVQKRALARTVVTSGPLVMPKPKPKPFLPKDWDKPKPTPLIENPQTSARGGGLSVLEGVLGAVIIVVTLGLMGVVAGYHRTILDWASHDAPKEGVEQRTSEYTGSVTAVPVAETIVPKIIPDANPAHLMLSKKTKAEQALFLGTAVKSSGDNCTGSKAFFMGTGSNSEAYWSVRCTNKHTFQVKILADAGGSTKVLDCAVLKAMSGVECFKRFAGQ